MAWNDERDGIGTYSRTHSADRRWPAQRARDVTVAAGFAAWNLLQSLPHALLEGRRTDIQREVYRERMFCNLTEHIRDRLREPPRGLTVSFNPGTREAVAQLGDGGSIGRCETDRTDANLGCSNE